MTPQSTWRRASSVDSLPLTHMECPSCGAEPADPEGVFCSRCGRTLGPIGDETSEALRAAGTEEELPAPDPAAAHESSAQETAPNPVAADEPAPDPAAADEAHAQETTPNPDAADQPAPTTDQPAPAADQAAPAANPLPADDSAPNESPRTPSVGVMAADMARSLGGALRSGRWPEAASAAAMGFLAVLGVGAVFVGLLKLVDPSFGADRNPLWVLTRVVIAGLASLGIPVEEGGAGGSILPMGTLVLVAWAIMWAARAVVAAADKKGSSERALEGAKVGAPFAILCCLAALIFRLREGIDTGADPGLALVIGGVWGAAFGAAGGLLADRSARTGGRPAKEGGAPVKGTLREGLMAGATMLISAAIAAMAAALIFVIADLVTGTDLRLTAGDAVALVILLVAFAPNIALGTVAFSMGAPMQFVADSLGVGFRTDFSLFGWGASGPEWYVYFAVLIPVFACLFGGYSARRRTHHPHKMVEIIAIAAVVLSISLSFLVYIGSLSLEHGLLGPGNLLVLSPDASAVFFLSLLWSGALGVVGWKVAESQPRPDQHEPSERSKV